MFRSAVAAVMSSSALLMGSAHAIVLELDVFVTSVSLGSAAAGLTPDDVALRGDMGTWRLEFSDVSGDLEPVDGVVQLIASDITFGMMTFAGTDPIIDSSVDPVLISSPVSAAGTPANTFVFLPDCCDQEISLTALPGPFNVIPFEEPVDFIDFLMRVNSWNGTVSALIANEAGFQTELTIEFSDTAPEIPVPGAGILLLTGAGLFAARRRSLKRG